jgi:hypothetical protein
VPTKAANAYFDRMSGAMQIAVGSYLAENPTPKA